MPKWILAVIIACITVQLALADDAPRKKKPKIYKVREGVTLTSVTQFRYDKPRIVIKLVAPKLIAESEEYTESVDLFNQSVQQLLKESANKYIEMITKNQSMPLDDGHNNNFYSDFDVSMIKSGGEHIISARFIISGQIANASKLFHEFYSFNYDFENGQLIQLSDLFKEDSDFLYIISEYVRNALYLHVSDKTMIDEGTQPNIDNYSTWNIKPTGLLFTFPPNQVSSADYGSQSILVPFSVLKKYLAAKSPLKKCIQNRWKCIESNVVTGSFIDEAQNRAKHHELNPLLSRFKNFLHSAALNR